MPSPKPYETVKQQCLSFEAIGFKTTFKMLGFDENAAPAVTLLRHGKVYKFSDVDWEVVISQLACLYQKVKSYPNLEFNIYLKKYNINR